MRSINIPVFFTLLIMLGVTGTALSKTPANANYTLVINLNSSSKPIKTKAIKNADIRRHYHAYTVYMPSMKKYKYRFRLGFFKK